MATIQTPLYEPSALALAVDSVAFAIPNVPYELDAQGRDRLQPRLRVGLVAQQPGMTE